MKIAFVTFYSLIDNSLEINNGFSFINHILKGDHFFISLLDNKDDLIKRFLPYEKIYASVSYLPQLNFINDISDDRWILGGQILEGFLNTENIKAKLYDKSFESHMGYQIESIFTPYWEKFIKTASPSSFRYNAVCSRSCYWKRCKYCVYRIVEPESYERDVRKVLKSLPVYDFPSTAVISTGSIPPLLLKEAIEISTHIDNNVKLQAYIRFDRHIKKIIKESDSLSHFVFCVGIESFSQKTLDRINKGTRIEDVLECIKFSLDKGAEVKAFILNNIPTDKESTKQNIESIEWIKDNVKYTPMKVNGNGYRTEGNFLINMGDGIEWPDEETAKEFGEYIIEEVKVKNFYKRVWPNNKRICSVISGKEKEMNKKVYDKIGELFSIVNFKS